jgi:hypothetical protein
MDAPIHVDLPVQDIDITDAAATPGGGPQQQRATGGGGGAVGNTPNTGVASGRAQQRAAFVQAQTDLLPTFNDLGVDVAPVATTVKVYLSPLNGGMAEVLIEATESMIAISTYNFLKSNFKFNEQGVLDVENGAPDLARFTAVFPEGPRAFSASKDQKEVTGQVAVLVAAQYIEAAVTILRFFRFNVFVTGGRLKSKTGYAVAVEASQGRGRRKQNVLPADVVRGLSLQVNVPGIGVAFDKDDHPGERLYILALTDEQFDRAHQEGGYRLLGDKRYLPFPYTPRAGKQKLYMHTSMHSIEAVEHDAVPQLAGWLGVPPSDIEVTLVGGNLIARDMLIICFTFTYTVDAYDQAFELTQRGVVRLVNPRKPRLGGMTARFAGTLDDMQTLLNARLLLPPRVTDNDEDDEDFVPLPVIPPDLLQGPSSGAE